MWTHVTPNSPGRAGGPVDDSAAQSLTPLLALAPWWIALGAGVLLAALVVALMLARASRKVRARDGDASFEQYDHLAVTPSTVPYGRHLAPPDVEVGAAEALDDAYVPPSATPAGWYATADGRFERYFDGQQWTGRARQRAPQ